MNKCNSKRSRVKAGIIPAGGSFDIIQPRSREVSPPHISQSVRSFPMSSPRSSRGKSAPVGFKTTVADTSTTLSPAMSLPVRFDSPKRETKSIEKKGAAITSESRNSSIHSILADFENSNISLTTPDKGERKNLSRNMKAKRLLMKKRQEIMELQKLVCQEQTMFLKLYAEIKELEIKSGIDSGDKLGKIRFLTMKGWLPHDILLLVKDTADPQKQNDFGGVLGMSVMQQIRTELSSITSEVTDLSNDLMARRLKLIENFRKRAQDPKLKNECDTETAQIQKMVLDSCKRLEAKINKSLELAETSWKDRDDLIAKIDSLNKEFANAQEKAIQDMKKNDIGNKITNSKSDSTTDLKAQLNKERSARESLKHMVETAEGLLRKARMRITVLERELKNTQKQMQASARKHQEYELMHRCRETSYGVRSKKLLEESKTGEEVIEMLTLQRNALELRIKELQEEFKSTIEKYEGQGSKHQDSLNRLQEKVDQEIKHRLAAEARAAELEKRVKQVHEEYRLLLEQSDNLIKMSTEKCLDYLPHKENEPTLKETELCKELQETKVKLEEVTAELRQSREDKENLLNSLARIAQEGSGNGNNMGNELLQREQKIFLLQKSIEELKQTIKSRNESLAQKERQIICLRMEASRADYTRADHECCSKDSAKQDLAIEIMELTEQVATLTRERDSLMKTAVSRTLMLERHERCAELFAQITRARRDMAALLEGQERSHSQADFAEVNLTNSLSPACMKAAKTFSELRSDRERMLQLQDVVASQNLQLKRERRVRNQLEQRRAILERLCLNRASSHYVPTENVAEYLGTSSYMANDYVKQS